MTVAQYPGPKYRQVFDHLREQMRSGELQPGDQLPSRSEMPALYGISPATAEKVLTLLVQEGLVVRELGRGTFVKTRPARELTGLLGFIAAPDMAESSYWSVFFEGMQHAGRQAGRDILVFNSQPDEASLKKVDGLVLSEKSWADAAWQNPDGNLAETVRTALSGLPHVSVLSYMASGAGVRADEGQGQYDATRHLLELGHRKIAILATLDPRFTARLNGYRRALTEHGISAEFDWVCQAPMFGSRTQAVQGGHHKMKMWLETNWHETGCTAIMANNDYVALGVIKAAREAGLSIPDDLSVVGFDGTDICEHVTPTLTTVSKPLAGIGEAAVDMLLRLIQEPDTETEILELPLTLQIGESSAAPTLPNSMRLQQA